MVQGFALLLLVSAITAIAFQQYKYRKIRRLYRADYARARRMKSISRLLPLMPAYKSKRYMRAEALIIDSGLDISVEGFYLVKAAFFIIGIVFFISIQTTNAFMQYNSIINDLNIEKSLIDAAVKAEAEDPELEKHIFRYVDSCLPKGKVTLQDLKSEKNSKMYIEYLEAQISSKWTGAAGLQEDTAETARRMYEKLVRIRTIESDYARYFAALAAAVFLYFTPNMIAYIKLKLIEDKRDWEILNYIYVFSIFGRMPPFNIKNVLSNIIVISEVYKPIINEALNAVKTGKGEAAFDNLLKRVENQELYELLESMRLSLSTGLLNMMDNIDEMAVNQLKWLEIKSIKRRKSKQIIAMVPVVLVMLMGMVYFSYSLSALSNPMNFIK